MDKDLEKLLEEAQELVIDGRLVVRSRPARPPRAVRTPKTTGSPGARRPTDQEEVKDDAE